MISTGRECGVAQKILLLGGLPCDARSDAFKMGQLEPQFDPSTSRHSHRNSIHKCEQCWCERAREMRCTRMPALTRSIEYHRLFRHVFLVRSHPTPGLMGSEPKEWKRVEQCRRSTQHKVRDDPQNGQRMSASSALPTYPFSFCSSHCSNEADSGCVAL